MAEVAELRAELKQQKAINRELLKRLYGSKSEHMDSDQLLLLLSEDEAKKPIAAETGGDEPEAETRKPVQGSSIVEKPFRFRFQWVGTANRPTANVMPIGNFTPIFIRPSCARLP